MIARILCELASTGAWCRPPAWCRLANRSITGPRSRSMRSRFISWVGREFSSMSWLLRHGEEIPPYRRNRARQNGPSPRVDDAPSRHESTIPRPPIRSITGSPSRTLDARRVLLRCLCQGYWSGGPYASCFGFLFFIILIRSTSIYLNSTSDERRVGRQEEVRVKRDGFRAVELCERLPGGSW